MKTHRWFNLRNHLLPCLRIASAGALFVAAVGIAFLRASPGPTPGANVRVTNDNHTTYTSADQLGGGSYTDAVLLRCGTDRRMQNEPTLAIDPRNTSVWASGANDYCTVPTAGDAWAGFYRSTNGGMTWTDSLLPGYNGDTSTQGTSSPLHALVAGGALAAGDPVMGWDGNGNLFYMGNNFSRGIENGVSGTTRNNIGTIWVATYAPKDPNDNSTDGSKYVRTVILAQNTFGNGQFNDKTSLAVDPASGNVYAAWSDFHFTGCNEVLFSRSTDHGATFSAPIKLSEGVCSNQGPSIAIGPSGTVYVGWEDHIGSHGAVFSFLTPLGAAFVSSNDFGQTFSKARVVATYSPFVSEQFSGGPRECGDAPFACSTGFTLPRIDLAGPYLAADNVHGTVAMAFEARQSSGQGQIEFVVSSNGGATWTSPALLAPSATGHQFYVFLAASNGRVNAIWYDSRGDPAYAATRPPCNNASGQTSACLNVRYAESTDGGSTWGSSVQVTNMPTNLNYEQFGGRRVPFFGDYITVAAQGDTIGAAWTDQRNTVGAADPGGDNDGADVSGDPETGGKCTSAFTTCFDGTGGLDQNIYAATITP
jgi:hypothetical protein